jgi:hypothetical protein
VTVRKRDAGRPSFSLLDVTTTVPEFKANVTEVEKGSRYEIEVTVTPTGDIHRGALKLKTDNKKHPELSVPLSFVKPRPPGRRGQPGQKKQQKRRIELKAK